MSEAKIIQRFPAGKVLLPPSKSLSHRAVICAGLAAPRGESRLQNVGVSQDIVATVACMEMLGFRIEAWDDALRVMPKSSDSLQPTPEKADTLQATHTLDCCEPDSTLQATPTLDCGESGSTLQAAPILDCGESGSTLRFLIPVAAMAGGTWCFTGHGRLMQRPLGVYFDLFKQVGARLRQKDNTVTVEGSLPGGVYHLPGNISSQFLSGMLLALPLAKEDSTLVVNGSLESAAYVDLTLDVMAAFGIRVTRNADGSFTIPGGQDYTPAAYTVEGDWSQAAFFLGAGALGRPVACGGLEQNSRQGDAASLSILEEMGASIVWKDGLVSASAERLKAVTIDARPIPDLVVPLAVLCCFAEGTSRITNAGRLRLKESDRLAALAAELHKLGADVQEEPEGLVITGKPTLAGGVVDAHNDHRIAMAMALAATRCTGNVALTGWESVQKSYPAFWTDFEKEAQHE